MIKVLVTGAGGFIGKNLGVRLGTRPDVEVLRYERGSSAEDLERAVAQADTICHLAGANRPDDWGDFARVNTELTRAVCNAVRRAGRAVPIVFASSVHVEHDYPDGSQLAAYASSKRAAEQVLLAYSKESGAPVHIFRFPHVIGKWCRPNYNSVVATFCHNVARDQPITVVNPAQGLRLVHVDDVVTAFMEIIDGRRQDGPYCAVDPCYPITVGELAEQIRSFRASRGSLVTERVGTGLARVLYATYLSYLQPGDFTYPLAAHADARGVFVEMLKTRDSGQFSFFTAHPGVTRGGHYHHSKSEKFLVVKGRARFRFRHVVSQQQHELFTSGDRPEVVEMVPGWTHDITNVGDDELVVMLWANEIFDPDRADTYPCPV